MIPLLIPVAAKLIATHWAATHAVVATHALAGGLEAHTAALAAPHAATIAAGKAGAVAGKAAAAHVGGSASLTGLHNVSSVFLPVHVLPYHAVVDAAVTTAAVGGLTTAVLSPTVTHAMTKFAEKFVTGYGVARLKREYGVHLDLGTVRRWFRSQPASDHIPVTATGAVRAGRFWPAECPSDGPVDLLQGYFNPRTGTLSNGRLIRDVERVSAPVRNSHRGSGLAFYLSDSAIRAGAA